MALAYGQDIPVSHVNYSLASVTSNLMYTEDPEEQLDTVNLITARIEQGTEGRFLFVESKFWVDLIEISIHDKQGVFKEFVMREKLNKPIQEMFFAFPETNLPKSGEILRIKLNGTTHYFTFMEW
jgi:hypothetical protein